MKFRWLRKIFNKRILVILLLLLQIAALVAIVFTNGIKSEIFLFVVDILGVISAIYILAKRGESAYKFTWLFVIIVLPIFGILLYLLFDRQASSKRFSEGVRESEERMRTFYNLMESDKNAAETCCENYAPQIKYLENYAGFPVFSGTEAKYYRIGEEMFEDLKAELEKAEKYIFMEYFILREGEMWNEILEILKKKAQLGVKVRVMYDDIGCLFGLPKNIKNTLKNYGIECGVFNAFRPFLITMQNNRDHRKITSIDGKIAFTGGINISDEYINKKVRFGHWKDTGIKLTGKAAWMLTMMFMQMWGFANGVKEDYGYYFPYKDSPCNIKGEGFFQPYMDSPTDKKDVGEQVYMHIITNAKKYLYITTPYLIIDDKMNSALTRAAQSGVDVRIITPHIADKKIVHATTRSYYKDLIDGGVKIYEYTNGFIHSKTFVADDEVAVVGTTNLDFRSLYLHFECGVVAYSNPVAEEVKKDFLETMEASGEISPSFCKEGFFKRIVNAFLRLFAPLM